MRGSIGIVREFGETLSTGKPGQYTEAMQVILELLKPARSIGVEDILRNTRGHNLPSEIVLECLEFLVSRRNLLLERSPDGKTRYLVTDPNGLVSIASKKRPGPGKIVLTLPAFNRFGLEQEMWSLGMNYDLTEVAFRELFLSAKKEILICSPFAEYNGLIRFADVFSACLASGCKILLLSRQISSQDRGSRFGQIREFLALLESRSIPLDGFEIRNYHFSDQSRVESSSHAKFIVVDGKKAYLGSADIRTNSFDRNLEVGLKVTGHRAEDLRRVFLAMFAEAAPVNGVRP